MKNWNKIIAFSLILFLLMTFVGCKSTEKEPPVGTHNTGISTDVSTGTFTENNKNDEIQENQEPVEADTNGFKIKVEKGLSYSTKDEVAAYIYKFHELPPNFITKKEAEELGWDNSKGNLWKVSNKKSIGGGRFYNREGLLPETDVRQYYECDINYHGGYRGAERIVYSNDGLIFYTDDHYESFERIY